MKTELKDVIHFYLGCMVELNNSGSKVYNRKLIAVGGVDDEPYCKLRLGNADEKQFVHAVFFKENRVKPILRPLSDMIYEEESYMKNNFCYKANGITEYYTPDGFMFLLKHGFDLFGLIESGQAIDATTINP